MNTKKILLFLLFAFGISWGSAGMVYAAGVVYGSAISMVATATLFMMAPALAAIIVQKTIYKQPLKELGLDFKKTKWKQMAWIPILQLALCLFFIASILLFGNLLQLKGFGFYSLDPELLDQRLNSMIPAGVPKIPIPPIVLPVIAIIGSIVFGGLINGLFTFGEELGWRGFMYNETKRLGFWKSNLLVGTIWGLWHAPLILQGHNYPEHPVSGVFMMIPFCTSLAFLMSWLRTKTNSVLAPAFLHGMLNAGAGGLMLLCYEYMDLVGNIAGIAGILAALLTLICILIMDRKAIKRQKEETDY